MTDLQIGVYVDDIFALDAIVHDRRTERLKGRPETRHRGGNILGGGFRYYRRKAMRRAHDFEGFTRSKGPTNAHDSFILVGRTSSHLLADSGSRSPRQAHRSISRQLSLIVVVGF